MIFTVTVWDKQAHEFLHKSELPTLGQAAGRIRSLMYNSEYKTDLDNGEVSMQLTVANFEVAK